MSLVSGFIQQTTHGSNSSHLKLVWILEIEYWRSNNFYYISWLIHITIKNNRLTTKTYQKPMNLYLYTPILLATGELLRYWNQKLDQNKIVKITTQLILSLINRDHNIHQISTTLKTAAATIDNINTSNRNKATTTDSDNTLFLNWQFHPNVIMRHIL